MSAVDVPTLAHMTARAQRIALAYFEAGYVEGLEAGRRAQVAEDAEAWANMRHIIRQAASSPDYATLCRRRGDHARAEATEALWRERGLAS